MRRDITQLRAGQTVGEALASLRERQPGGRIVYFYVVDADGRIEGVLPTRRLLLSPPDTPVADVMVRPVVTVPHTATVLEACALFTRHKLLAFPVVDDDNKPIGLVDVDLYTEEMAGLERRQEADDLFQLVGVHLTEAEQKNAPLAFRRRFPWLLCNVVGGMLAAVLADAFGDVATLALVAPFIALVTGLAEGVSIQSISLALLTMHGRPPTWRGLAWKLGREALVGVLLGAASGLIVGLVGLLWKGSVWVGLTLGLGIAGGVLASAVVGLGLPYLLKLLRRDPQVASGPIALAAGDVVTLILYFSLCRWLLR
jgi:magnesium transporter